MSLENPSTKRPALSGPGSCGEKQRLLDAFGEAVQELLSFIEQQFLAVTANDPDFNRFDLLIHMAVERKQRAKYEYLQHIEQHGCCRST